MKRLIIVLAMALPLLSAVYYVDPDGGRGYNPSQAGTIGDPFMGIYGIQRAIDAASTAGDTILIRQGTHQMGMMVRLTVSDTTGFVLGDSVQNKVGSGDDWTAVHCRNNTATTLTVELRTGNYSDVDIADSLENVTTPSTVQVTAKAVPYLLTMSVASTGENPVRIIGTLTDWSIVDSAPVLLTGGVDSAAVDTAMKVVGDWRGVGSIAFSRCGVALAGTGAATQLSYIHIFNARTGIGTLGAYTVARNIIARDCIVGVTVGATGDYSEIFVTETRRGLSVLGADCTIENFVVANCDTGVTIFNARVHLRGFVAYGGLIGVYTDNRPGTKITRGRIVSNVTGIQAGAGDWNKVSRQNYFAENTTNLTGWSLHHTDTEGTYHGLVDPAGGNFSTADTAQMRRVPINLEWAE